MTTRLLEKFERETDPVTLKAARVKVQFFEDLASRAKTASSNNTGASKDSKSDSNSSSAGPVRGRLRISDVASFATTQDTSKYNTTVCNLDYQPQPTPQYPSCEVPSPSTYTSTSPEDHLPSPCQFIHLGPRARRRARRMGSHPGKRQDGGRIGRRRVIHQEKDVDAPNVIKGLVPGVRARPKLSEQPIRLPPKNVNIKNGNNDHDHGNRGLGPGASRARKLGPRSQGASKDGRGGLLRPGVPVANPYGTSWAERAQHAGVNTWVVNPRHEGGREYAYLRFKKGEVERSIRGLRSTEEGGGGGPGNQGPPQLLVGIHSGAPRHPSPGAGPRSHPLEAFVSSWRPHPRFDIVRRVNTLRERVGTLDLMMCRLRAMVQHKLRPAALGARRHDVLCRIASYQYPPFGLTWDEPLTRRWELRSYPDPLPRYQGWSRGYKD
ncbi:hypothetical protein Bbelb_185840 [Branchiostoma belcheri]|nr:hypothetical protein Bbelb_185840 [Branchiostoma belcheri]